MHLSMLKQAHKNAYNKTMIKFKAKLQKQRENAKASKAQNISQ